MVSYDLPRSMVTSQVAFNQRALHSSNRTRDGRPLPGAGFQIPVLLTSSFFSKELFFVELILVKSYKKCFKNYQNEFDEIGCISFLDYYV